MSVDDHVAAVRCLHACANAHDLAALQALFAPIYVLYDPNVPTARARDDRHELAIQARTAVPAFQWQADELLVVGEVVVDQWTFSGTHAVSGAHVRFSGITIYHFADGKIVAEWTAYDAGGAAWLRGRLPTTRRGRSAEVGAHPSGDRRRRDPER